MAKYSHSKLSTFEQCPFKYKLRYIDKIKPPITQTIEMHLGKCVHAALEWIYNEIINQNPIPTIEQVIEYYAREWQDTYNEETFIKDKTLTQKDYFNKGVGFLVNYYTENAPFQDNTLEVEKQVELELGGHKIWGFIDRLAYDRKTGEYSIHDYKTANNLPSKEKIDTDRQLALYSIAIQEIFNTKKEVNMVWHYLNFNKRIRAKRTQAELDQLKKDIIELIGKIEAAKEFPTCQSVLCNWCEYKSMCPEFGGSIPEKNDIDNYPTTKKYLKKN